MVPSLYIYLYGGTYPHTRTYIYLRSPVGVDRTYAYTEVPLGTTRLILIPEGLYLYYGVYTCSEVPVAKDENIGFDGYIGTWILRIYRIYWGYIGDISMDIFT